MANVDYLGTGNDDGTVFGRSDEKIGFYGLATPIVKPTRTFGETSGSSATASIAADLYNLRATLAALGLLTTA